MTEANRVAIYVRVSTDEQALRGFSIPDQLMKLEAYCRSRNLQIADEYIDDGYSGRSPKRPGYQRMFSEEERKKWDVVLVLKMDRIHRNAREFMAMMDDLNRHHQNYLSVMDNIDTSNAIGRFVMDTLQRIAQLESEQIGERTHLAMRQKAISNDGIMGFNPPFGYTISDGGLTTVEDESIVAKRIFSDYLSGMTMDDIAANLNNSLTLTRRRNKWNKFNLRNILHNPVYAGYMRWEDILIKHDADAVVTVDEFNTVQNLMASKVRDPNKRNPELIDIENKRSILV